MGVVDLFDEKDDFEKIVEENHKLIDWWNNYIKEEESRVVAKPTKTIDMTKVNHKELLLDNQLML